MSTIDQQWDDFISPMDDEDEHYITCQRCGETHLHWQAVISADGKGENHRLFNARGRKHECSIPDNFSVVPE